MGIGKSVQVLSFALLLKQQRPDSQQLQEMLDTRLKDLLNYWRMEQQPQSSPGATAMDSNHSGRSGDSSSCRKRKLLTLYYGDEDGCDIKEEHRGFPCLCGDFVASSAGNHNGNAATVRGSGGGVGSGAVSPAARRSGGKRKGEGSPKTVKQKRSADNGGGGGGGGDREATVTCVCCNKPRHLRCAKIDPSSKSDSEDDYGETTHLHSY